MKKRFSWLYILYCVGVVVVLTTVIFAVTRAKQSKDEEIDTDDTISVNNGVFSASRIDLEINNGEDVEVEVGCDVEFLDGFITTKPYSYAKSIKYYYCNEELTDKSIMFSTTGVYPIKLVLGDSQVGSFNINVVSEDYPFVQNKSIMRSNQTRTLSQMFSLPDADYDVSVDGCLRLNDNYLIPESAGIGNVIFSITKNKMKVKYSFEITVTDDQEFELSIINPTDEPTINLNSNTRLNIDYTISPMSEYEDMIVDVEIIGANISANKIIVSSPIVTIDFDELKDLDIDTVIVKLTLRSDSRVEASLKVNFIR